MSISAVANQPFRYVRESNDEFLELFPHRFDYIWAEHPDPGESVRWKTESRYPLSDRLIQQGSCLYGVRFGVQTSYGLLDIDIESPYHPRQDPFAVSRIVAALEPIGLVSAVICTSSYSGGLHLYFPFEQAQSSWQVAIGLATLLENAGFKLIPGQLEVFPNPKPYSVDRKPTLFNAHRLPLQLGSYLLNADLQPIWSDPQAFVQQWRLAQSRNHLEPIILRRLLKQVKRQHFHLSGKADKFINDLNTEIELGWTGHGQTNRLLGRITMRTYIFHHVLSGGEPLTGQTLVDEIVETARSLPGYSEWCRHQHEIEQRAEEWARCIEKSHYFRYGSQVKLKLSKLELAEAVEAAPTWNQQQAESAREKIRRAIADLLERGVLPAKATARFHTLLQYGIGGGSLYRHRDLWHPAHLVEIPPNPPVSDQNQQLDCTASASNWQASPSLFPAPGGNPAVCKGSVDSTVMDDRTSGGNLHLDLSGCQVSVDCQEGQPLLSAITTNQMVYREAWQIAVERQEQIRKESAEAKQIARMQQFLKSGDPILIAEALAWMQINPGLLAIDDI